MGNMAIRNGWSCFDIDRRGPPVQVAFERNAHKTAHLVNFSYSQAYQLKRETSNVMEPFGLPLADTLLFQLNMYKSKEVYFKLLPLTIFHEYCLSKIMKLGFRY